MYGLNVVVVVVAAAVVVLITLRDTQQKDCLTAISSTV
jgi:preprotein translocase subunit SecG